MSKRTFIAFGILILVLAVAIPWLVFRSKGEAGHGAPHIAANLEASKSLFEINCGTCHVLNSAGTVGNYGPNLDELLAPTGEPTTGKDDLKPIEGRVLSAIENGIDSEAPGRMPPGILNEEQAKEVAQFVAATAGEG